MKRFSVVIRLSVWRPTSADERRAFGGEAFYRIPGVIIEWSANLRSVTVRMEREASDADAVCLGAPALIQGWAQDDTKLGDDSELSIRCEAEEIG